MKHLFFKPFLLRMLILITFSHAFINIYAQDKPDAYPPVTNVFPLLWKAKTGAASFRTNPVLNGKYLIIGSNGSNFKDFYLKDKGAGVYVLDRSSGRKLHQIGSGDFGDMDVNGVLVYNGKLYFGNDNEEFICSTMDGTILWINPASGDIEHEPALISINGQPAIVYATESGEVKAVDPQNGKIIWSYYTNDFNGWKPGDNRAVFKVKAFFSNTQSFFTKPQLADINKDGILDLIYNTYNNKLIALSGASGKCLWERDWDNALSYGMNLNHSSNELLFGLVFTKWQPEQSKSTHTFSLIDKAGNIKKQIPISGNDGEGLNMTEISSESTALLMNDALLIVHMDGKVDYIDRKDKYQFKSYSGSTYVSNRYSPNSLLSTRTFQYGEQGNCILVFNQHDWTTEGKGSIELISLDSKKVVKRYALPSSGEMIPLVEDVNQDGYLDLLVNGYDGYTYCFNMKIPAYPRYALQNKK